MFGSVKTCLMVCVSYWLAACRRNAFHGVVKRTLGCRSMPLASALMAIMLAAPSIWSGLQIDDWWMRAAMLSPPGLEAAFSSDSSGLFRIADGNTERTRQLVDIGVLPWWTPSSFKLWFWRPASEWTHRLDYFLWPDNPMLMHFQSILWFGGWVLVASFYFRRLIPVRWVAGLAGILFALDYGHALPACWLAARNAVLAGLYGTLCLLCHDVWRRGRFAFPGFCASFFLMLALLCKEAAVGVFAYLVSYAVFLDTGRIRLRLGSLVPYAMIVVAWFIIYRAIGFGVVGSTMYLDPLDSSWAFIRGVVHRAPILLLSQWALPPAETIWILRPFGELVLWGFAVVAVAALIYLLLPVLRTDRTARFFFFGMLMAVVPACLGMMSSRQLEYVGLGAAGLLALLLRHLWRNVCAAQSVAKGHAYMAILVSLLVIHLVISPVIFVMTHRYFVRTTQAQEVALVQDNMMCPSLAGKNVILVNPPLTSHSAYLLILRALEGYSFPKRVWSLAPGRGQSQEVWIRRLDEYSLKVQVEGGVLIDLASSHKHPIHPGSRIVLDGMTVRVLDINGENSPALMVFTWSEPLDSSAYVWFRMHDGHYVPWQPPAVGSAMQLVP